MPCTGDSCLTLVLLARIQPHVMFNPSYLRVSYHTHTIQLSINGLPFRLPGTWWLRHSSQVCQQTCLLFLHSFLHCLLVFPSALHSSPPSPTPDPTPHPALIFVASLSAELRDETRTVARTTTRHLEQLPARTEGRRWAASVGIGIGGAGMNRGVREPRCRRRDPSNVNPQAFRASTPNFHCLGGRYAISRPHERSRRGGRRA